MANLIDQRGTAYRDPKNDDRRAALRVATFRDATVILSLDGPCVTASAHIDKKAAVDFALAIIASVQVEAPEDLPEAGSA